MNKKDLLILIPARKGSKRLVNKNIYPLCGQPLIYWSIQTALEADNIFDGEIELDIAVSTDSKDIQEYIQKEFNTAKNEPIFIIDRPSELAEDNTTSEDTTLHALDWFKEQYQLEFKTLMLLQPTSPIRDCLDVTFFYHAYKYYETKAMVSKCHTGSKQNGSIYIRDVQDLYENKTFYPRYWMPLGMVGNGIKDVDVNTIEDIYEAERIIKEYKLHEEHESERKI